MQDSAALDLANPDTYEDGYPHDYLRQLRREDPVHWNPPGDPDCSAIAPITTGHWAITRHTDIVDVSRDPKTFSSHAGSMFIHDVPEADLAGMRLMLINNDPPIHTKQRRQHPNDTLMSHFVHRTFEGRTVGEDEIAFFFTLLLAAGTETTQTATAAAMEHLSRLPEQKALLLSDIDAHLPGAIEEVLRFEPPVLLMRRTATRDTELRGKRIAAGDKVVLYYAAANRDEDVFERPDEFDITRNPNPHLSFGIGQHFCLGANLARMQLRCILREIFTRLPGIERSGPIARQRSNVVNGYKQMPVRFRPER